MDSFTAQAPRITRRLSCDLFFAGARHQGVVLNVSRSGLFVQTSVAAQPGSNVGIKLNGPQGENLELDTKVVWKRIAELQITGITRSGVGLQIRHASPGYLEFLENLAQRKIRPAPASATLMRYQVRVEVAGEPRSRTLTVFAETREAASFQALEKVGEGWTVIELEEQTLG